jgi:urease accessory protein
MTTGRTALLLLADGRFPAGGHAHSGGAEAAVADGRIRDVATLAEFCRGRLHSTGLGAAAQAAAAAAGGGPPRGGGARAGGGAPPPPGATRSPSTTRRTRERPR